VGILKGNHILEKELFFFFFFFFFFLSYFNSSSNEIKLPWNWMFGVSRKFHGGERERERESDEGEWLLLYPGDDDKVAWSQGDAL
jgi:hypothetical protein